MTPPTKTRPGDGHQRGGISKDLPKDIFAQCGSCAQQFTQHGCTVATKLAAATTCPSSIGLKAPAPDSSAEAAARHLSNSRLRRRRVRGRLARALGPICYPTVIGTTELYYVSINYRSTIITHETWREKVSLHAAVVGRPPGPHKHEKSQHFFAPAQQVCACAYP